MTIEENAAAPDFRLAATGDQTLSLADFGGKYLVLYFYPRDNTPGCTQEGQDFRDLYSEFQALDADILGVSCDSVKKHENFKAKHDFPFALASDPDEIACRAFDVIKEKKLYGKPYVGIERSTFLIGPDARLLRIWRGVKVKGHAAEALEAVRAHAAG